MYIAAEFKTDLGVTVGYVGLDADKIKSHSNNGSDGMMVVFFSKEEYDHQRINHLNNSYLILFCCPKKKGLNHNNYF